MPNFSDVFFIYSNYQNCFILSAIKDVAHFMERNLMLGPMLHYQQSNAVCRLKTKKKKQHQNKLYLIVEVRQGISAICQVGRFSFLVGIIAQRMFVFILQHAAEVTFTKSKQVCNLIRKVVNYLFQFFMVTVSGHAILNFKMQSRLLWVLMLIIRISVKMCGLDVANNEQKMQQKNHDMLFAIINVVCFCNSAATLLSFFFQVCCCMIS